nr:sialyltransferase-like protein 2 [Quercus suber]
MPDMDPYEVGPSVQTVLRRQAMHRSSLLWDAPLEGEEVPGVLTCRHRDKGLLEYGAVLDPRIVAYITDAGRVGAGSSDPLAACSITKKQVEREPVALSNLRKVASDHENM